PLDRRRRRMGSGGGSARGGRSGRVRRRAPAREGRVPRPRREEAHGLMAAVRASDLFYLYRASHGDVAALRGLSLEVAAGEAVAVLGPSGAGKSTLLALLAGFARPASGELTVLDRSVEELPRLRRRS